MNTNNMLLATLVGGVVHFLLGWLVWGIMLANYMDGQAGSATGVSRGESMEFWAIAVSSLAFAGLLALIFGRWAGIRTLKSGAIAGAAIGALMAISFDMVMYGTTHIMTLNGMIVDILAAVVVSAIVGGIVGIVLGRGKEMVVA